MKSSLTFVNKLPLLSPFRYRNFRLYWIGLLVAITGHQVQMFTKLWFVYELTGSPFYLGLVGGTLAISTILFSMFGGVVADRVDRRKLLLFTQSCMGFIIFILATLIVLKIVTVWHIIIISGFNGMVQAFDRPARDVLLPHLIEDRKDLINALSLSSAVWQMARIAGPSIAGILIATVGAAFSFYLSAVLYFAMITTVILLRVPNQIKPGGDMKMWKSFQEGLAHIYHSTVFSAIIGMTFVNSVFGLSYSFLLPIFTKDILKVGPQEYGFIVTAHGVGGLIGTLTAAFLGPVRRKYIPLIGGSLAFGFLLIIFASSETYLLSLFIVSVAAMFTNLYMMVGQTLLQSLVPDHLRGRVMSTYGLVWSLIPLGSLQSGTVATYLGAPMAVTIGAVVLISFSLFILIAAPSLRRVRI